MPTKWVKDFEKLKSRYLALLDLAFLDRGINPLFIGNPGTGKTFLARALAYKACTETRRVVFILVAKMLNELHGAELHGRIERFLRKYTHAEPLGRVEAGSSGVGGGRLKIGLDTAADFSNLERARGAVGSAAGCICGPGRCAPAWVER